MMTRVYDVSFGTGYTRIPMDVAERIYGLWLNYKSNANK